VNPREGASGVRLDTAKRLPNAIRLLTDRHFSGLGLSDHIDTVADEDPTAKNDRLDRGPKRYGHKCKTLLGDLESGEIETRNSIRLR
jgi:hypothetical protein